VTVSDEEALIAGIREAPLDDLRRLVYADWLDERGRSDEAEYLRLVAAVAAPGTPVEAAHPHAVRLLALADRLDPTWRAGVGARFDLWFDPPYDPAWKIHFIKCVREMTGLGLAEAKAFSESLPKVLSGAVPYEEAVGQAVRFDGTNARHRVQPSTEVPARGLLRRGLALVWYANWDDDTGAHRTSVADTAAALAHLRRLLAAHPETAHLAATVPHPADGPLNDYSVTLVAGLLVAEAARQTERWRDRLFGDLNLDGATADPPFSGRIGVHPVWE
jgi:uncharacterized protein (TIGR02996 family)